jgi:hypothetical protein
MSDDLDMTERKPDVIKVRKGGKPKKAIDTVELAETDQPLVINSISAEDIEELELDDELEAEAPRGREKKPASNVLLILIVILLVLQVALSGYNTVNTYLVEQQRSVERAQIINEAAQYAANVDSVSRQMIQNFQNDVYKNKDVDSPEKQQVMGAEYNFMGLMLLSQQNSKLVELLAKLR